MNISNTLNPKRGEVYYVINDSNKIGSIQSGTRPAVIVSNDIGNKYAPVVTVAYMTTAIKKRLPTHVVTMCTGKESTILCEQVNTISKEMLGKCIGRLSHKDIKAVDAALACSVGL